MFGFKDLFATVFFVVVFSIPSLFGGFQQAHATTVIEFTGDPNKAGSWFRGGLNNEVLSFQTFTVPDQDSNLNEFSVIINFTSLGKSRGATINSSIFVWDELSNKPTGDAIWTGSDLVTDVDPKFKINFPGGSDYEIANFSPNINLISGVKYVFTFNGPSGLWNGLIQSGTPYNHGMGGLVVAAAASWDGPFDLPMSLTFGSAVPVIANTIVEDTQKVIASFMLNRASQILSNQPDLIGFLEGTNSGGGGPLGYLAVNGNDDSIELAFSSSLSKVDRARAESLQQLATRRVSDAHNALTFAAETPNVAYGGDLAGNGYMPTRKYDIWTQIYGSTTSAGDSDNSFWIGYLGAHYFVTPDMIIGGLVQLDWADEDNGTSGSSADGQGWMIGPYIAGRITGTGLNYEARASWGRSSNNVSPLGTYTDEFETERWLASFKLKGDYMLDMVTFRPSVSVSYFEEEQESYTDSLSNIIPSQTISLGEVRFGPEFIRDIALSEGSLFRPSIGISGVWNFGVEEGASPQGYALGNDDLRARLDAGFSLTNPYGMMISAAAYYDGIAIDEYESMGGNVNVSIPIR